MDTEHGRLPGHAALRPYGPALAQSGTSSFSYDGFDELAQEIGATAALVLAELVVQSNMRHGRLVCRASERALASDLSRWGVGFSRASVRKALLTLSSAGLAVVAGHGIYELAPWLSAATAANLAPSGHQRLDQEGSQYGQPLPPSSHQAPANSVALPPPLVVLEYQEGKEVVEEISHLQSKNLEANSLTQAIRSAQSMGLGPRALEQVQHDPERALAWIEYATTTPSVRTPPGLVYDMMTAPHRPWPPTAPASSPAPQRAVQALRNRATTDEIRQALTHNVDTAGTPLGQSPSYHEVFLAELQALGPDDAASARAQYTAHFKAMRSLGLLADRLPPFGDAPVSVSAASR